MSIIEVLTPVLVALVTVFGSITVAKISRVQKNITTNGDTTSIGNAVDTLMDKVNCLSDQVSKVQSSSDVIHTNIIAQLNNNSARLSNIEKSQAAFHHPDNDGKEDE